MDYKSFINQDLADDPFSLLPEEEKEKLAQQALNLDTERDFLEDFVGFGIEVGLPITMMPVKDEFSRTFKGPVAAGIRNIIPSWQQSSLGNDKRRTTEEFLVETGAIEPKKPIGFVGGGGMDGSAGNFLRPMEDKLLRDVRREKEAAFNALPELEKKEMVREFAIFLDNNREQWEALQKKIDKNNEGLGKLGMAVSNGITSLGMMTPALLATLATRNPSFMYGMLPVFGQYERGATYNEAINSGLSHRESARVAEISALSEMGTELIPLPFVSRTLKRYWKGNGTTVNEFARNGAITVGLELGQENLNTVIQELNKASAGVQTELAFAWANKDNPLYNGPSWVDVMADNALMTSISTIVASGGMVGTQGVAAFGPDLQVKLLNSLDPNIARQVARELDLAVRRSEAQFKAIDETYQYAYINDMFNPGLADIAAVDESTPLDPNNPIDMESFKTTSRIAYYQNNREILPDEFLAGRILANDLVVEELTEDEKNLAIEYGSLFGDFENVDIPALLENGRKTINIMGQYPNDIQEFDAQVQERIETIDQQIKNEEGKKEPNTKKIESLKNDKNTLNEFLNREKFDGPLPSLEQLKEYDNVYPEEDIKTDQRDIDDFEIQANEKQFIDQEIQKPSDPNQVEQTKIEFIDPLRFDPRNLTFATVDDSFGGMLDPGGVSFVDIEKQIIAGTFKQDPNATISITKLAPRFKHTRDLTEQEATKVAEVLNNAFNMGLPKEVLNDLGFIGVHSNLKPSFFSIGGNQEQTALGLYTPGARTITLSSKQLRDASEFTQNLNVRDLNNFELGRTASLQTTLLHEIGHHLDFNYTESNNPDLSGKPFSSDSPLFEFMNFNQEIKNLEEQFGKNIEDITQNEIFMNWTPTTGGAVFRELYGLYAGGIYGANLSDLSGRMLSYPFNRIIIDSVKFEMGQTLPTDLVATAKKEVMSPYKEGDSMQEVIKFELFAQAYGLYYTNPRMMEQRAPETVKLIKGINDAVSSNRLSQIGSGIRDAFQSPRSDGDTKVYSTRLNSRDYQELVGEESTSRGVGTEVETVGRDNIRQPVQQEPPLESNYVPIGELKLNEKNKTFAGAPKRADGTFANTQRNFNKLARDLVKLAEDPLSLIDQSRNWYQNVNQSIEELTRGDQKLKEDVMRMLTIYSSQTPVESNLAFTLRSMVERAKGGKPLRGFQEDAGEFVSIALAAQDFGQKLPGVGFKLQSFYENLTGRNPNSVTMDTWMFRLLGFQENQNKIANHRYGTAVIREATRLYNEKNNDNLSPMQMQAVLWTYARNKDLQKKGKQPEYIGYETYLDKASSIVTGEVIPTKDLEHFAFGEKLTPRAKAQMTRELLDLITTSEGKNKIMELFPGTSLYKFSHSFGAYDGNINPNVLSSLVLEKVKGEQEFDAVDLSYADDFARAWGFVFRQDAVPHFVSNENISLDEINDLSNESVNSGTEITFVNKKNNEPIEISSLMRQQIYDALRAQGIDGFTQLNQSEIAVINFKYQNQIIENFNEKVEQAMRSIDIQDVGFAEQHDIRYNTQYIQNNWKENADGQGYLEGRLKEKGVQQRLVRIRSEVDSVFDKYRNGEYERSPADGAFPTTGQEKDLKLSSERPSVVTKEQQDIILESLEQLPPQDPPPPPPPGGPDPSGNFSLREKTYFQNLIEDFNITVANRFGRVWTIENDLIYQFGEQQIFKRLEDLGIDPNARDWKVSTQTDLFQGRVKDLLRDVREEYAEPLIKFLVDNRISEPEYNQFIYNLHAPERNAYLPTLFEEKLAEAELSLAEVEKNKDATKQDLANARRRVTTIKNKILKAEKGSGIETEVAIAYLKKAGVIFDMKSMTARGSLAKGKRLLEAYETYHKPLLDFTRQIFSDSGLISEDRVSDWNARYKYYVPLQGFAEDTLIDPETGREIERRQSRNNFVNSQMTVSGTLVKQAKGRESLADSPLQQTVIQATAAAIEAEKNRVVKALADLARAFPNDSIWSVSEDVGQIKTVDASWDPSKGRSRVGFKEDGVQKYVEIYDKRLSKGFDNFDTAVTGTLMQMTRGATRYLSMVNTSLDPFFMVNNFIRDVQAGFYNLLTEEEMAGGRAKDLEGKGLEIAKKYYTSKNVMSNAMNLILFEKNRSINLGPDVVAELKSLQPEELTEQKIQELQKKYSFYSSSNQYRVTKEKIVKQVKLQKFKEYGGETGYIDQRNQDRLTKDFEDLMQMYEGTFKGNVKNATKSIFDMIERMNMGIENAARFTAFEGYIELSGGVENMTPIQYERAAALAKNLTINFNRMGTMGPTANAMYMFFNASIQGTVNVLRGINPADPKFYASRKGKAIMGIIGMAVASTFHNLFSSDEDEDGRLYYEKLSDWEKQTKFILMFNNLPSYRIEDGQVTVEKWGMGSKYFVDDRSGRKVQIGLGVPLPYGYAMFHNMGRIGTEQIMAQHLDNYDKSLAKSSLELGESLLHNYAPLSVATSSDEPGAFLETAGITALPTVAKPIGEIIANRDHFGTPIYYEPMFNDTLPAAHRENKRVLPFIKSTHKFMNDATGGNEYYSGKFDVDPGITQYLLDYATGGLGRSARRLYNLAFSPDRPKQSQIPLFRRVTVSPNDGTDRQYFRELVAEVKEIENAYKNLTDDLDASEDPDEFLERINYPLGDVGNMLNQYATRKYGNNSLVNRVEKQLKDIRKLQKELYNDFYETDKERYYEEYNLLEEEELALMKEFIFDVREAKKGAK
jgi:hypothetical protein